MPFGSSSLLVTCFSIVTWCVYCLKLIVIAGLPFILSGVMAAPALPCEPPPAPSSARDPSHTHRRRGGDSGGIDIA
jgi:hypothetical protein